MKVLLSRTRLVILAVVNLLLVTGCSGFLLHPTFTTATTSIRNQGLAARRRNRSSEEDSSAGADDKSGEIPQLPSFGSSSFDSTAAAERKFSADEKEPKAAFVGRKFELQYTCKICETRNVHKVSRIAYNKGVVITICKGCMSQHLISDNLGFTQQFDGNLEDYFKEQGSEESVQRVSEDVFNLEKILGVDTKSGSIFGPNGTTHME